VCGYVEEGMRQPGGKLLFGGLPPKTGPLAQAGHGVYAVGPARFVLTEYAL
jgi:hypothetical protein